MAKVTTVLTYLCPTATVFPAAVMGVRQSQARLVKTVKIQRKWAAAHPGQDLRRPDTSMASAGEVEHSILGRDQGDLASGSPSTRSRPGPTLPSNDANRETAQCTSQAYERT